MYHYDNIYSFSRMPARAYAVGLQATARHLHSGVRTKMATVGRLEGMSGRLAIRKVSPGIARGWMTSLLLRGQITLCLALFRHG